MVKENNLDTFKISEVKPLQRFKRKGWNFHTFKFIKKDEFTFHYKSELTGKVYETTNINMIVTLIR